MDSRKHFSVYSFYSGEDEEEVGENDDVLEYSTHSTPTGTIYPVLNIDGIS